MPDSRNKGGRKPRVADEDLLDVFRATTDPVLSTAEVAEAVSIQRRGTLNRLRALEDADEVDSKQIGGRNTVWWLVQDNGQTAREGAGSSPVEEPDRSPADPPSTPRAGEDVSTDGQSFDEVDFPAGKDREQCLEAIDAAQSYLQTEGPATMREIVAAVHPDHPLGYDVDAALAKVEAGERYRGAWWRRIVKPGLDEDEDVQSPSPGQSEWRYTGGDR